MPWKRVVSLIWAVAAIATVCHGMEKAGEKEAEMTEQTIVREPAGADFWYAGDAAELAANVDRYIHKAEFVKAPGKVIALVSPHAGYRFSGPVAGAAFRQVKGHQYETVIVVGLSHRQRIAKASVFAGDYYKTPLGRLKVDKDVVSALLENSEVFTFNREAHSTHQSFFDSGGEHSVENQVPFLQRTVQDFKMVEILINTEDLDLCRKAGQAIAKAVKDKDVLLVASTDLTHWPSYEDATRIDNQALEVLEQLDVDKVWQGLAQLEKESAGVFNLSCVMCSKAAVVTVFAAANELGADKAMTLHYANSGDTAGSHDKVVGYGAMALYDTNQPVQQMAEEQKKNEKVSPDAEGSLTAQQKHSLLYIARSTLQEVCAGRPIPEFEIDDPVLHERRGCFVTLTKNGNLRGCIGRFDVSDPLYITVAQMARAAALEDPRFPPLRSPELNEIQIEMTIFPENPRRKIEGPDDIEIGRHGLYIKKGVYAGTLLPQVASERGWDPVTFLEQTCLKAHLPQDAWKEPDTEIYVYPGDIFHEEK
jgi:hypothetical protein